MPEGKLNVVSDTVIAALRQQRQATTTTASGVTATDGRASPSDEVPRQQTILVNDTSEDVPAGGCLAIVDSFQCGYGQRFLKFTKPSTTFHRRYMFAPLGGVPANGTAVAPDGPDYFSLYNSGTPANDEGYGPTPDQWYLTKGYPQCAVCTGIYDSTAKIMLATLGPIETLIGFATGDVSAASGDITSAGLTPGSATIKVCYFDGTKFLKVDDSYTVTGKNLTALTFKASKALKLQNVNGIWIIDDKWAAIDNLNTGAFQGLVNNSGAAKWDDPAAC